MFQILNHFQILYKEKFQTFFSKFDNIDSICEYGLEVRDLYKSDISVWTFHSSSRFSLLASCLSDCTPSGQVLHIIFRRITKGLSWGSL